MIFVKIQMTMPLLDHFDDLFQFVQIEALA